MKPKIITNGIRNVTFGKDVVVINPVNLYGCSLGNNVFIGPFVEIQSNSFIGDFTRIQSHSFICEGVIIGKHCFVSHGVMFINDLVRSGVPARTDKKKWITTTIGNYVTIGSNATLLPVTICSNVVIGAGSVVTRDITKSGIYAGNPAKLLRHFFDKTKK